jgi:hypothetical protein
MIAIFLMWQHSCRQAEAEIMIEKQVRFKVMIRAYMRGPWSSIIERPVTAISWGPHGFTITKMAYGNSNDSKPLLFSKTAAEAVVSQLDRFKFAGPGPEGKATAKIIPVEVK